MIIYSTGYAGKRSLDLKEMAEHLGATVIDIRYDPYSSMPEWNQKELQALLGERYCHIKALGNKAHREYRIEIADIESGIEQLCDFDVIILLCGCSKFSFCHRRVIAEELEARGQ